MTEEALLAISDLEVRYGDLVAVDRLGLEVRRGETLGLIGPDGAGKTSTLRAALGLVVPSGGSLRVCGLDPARERRELANQVGYLSQHFSLYGDLSVDENIAFFAEIHGVLGWRPRREELLEMVRLTPFRRRLADRLSGGMRQKLALVCTLVHTPTLLILDEPTTGVDPVSRRDFWVVLSRLQREGLTLVMTTPYLDEAERCQRVALMHRGRLLAVDDPRTLRRSFEGRIVEVLARPQGPVARLLEDQAAVRSVEAFGERLHVTVEPADDGEAGRLTDGFRQALGEAGAEVEMVRLIGASLEDAFIALIREADTAGPIQEKAS